MTRIPVAVAAAFVTLAACAQDIRFVPGQGSLEELSDVERGVALLAIDTLASDLGIARESHVVHEAGNRAFRCVQNKNLGGITAGGDLTFGPQLVAARRDLAARLGVTERDIQFVAAESKVFPDASLGCPEPGMQYVQAQVPGWVLSFRRGERVFTYHADDERAIPCPPIAAD
jgi:hypothetical protein